MDRTASRIFNRCINRLKSRDWLAPEVVRFHARPHIETLRKQREAIIRELGTPGEQHHEKERFEETLFRRLSREVTQCVAKEQLPRYREELAKQEAIRERFEELRRRLESDLPGIIREQYRRHPRYRHWKGCKVLVTSDTCARQSDVADLTGGSRMIMFYSGSGDADVVVVTANPRPVAWLMHRVLKEGEGFINYQNKYELFARIALAAREYLQEHGECTTEMQERGLLLKCLQEPMEMLAEYLTRLQKAADELSACLPRPASA